MLEFTGVGIEAQRQAMMDKEDRMAALGARMIHEGRNRNEASDTARMRGRSELALLTNVVNMSQAGLERILRLAAEWTGGNPNEVKVVFNRDWVETRMDANELTALIKAWQAGGISHQTLWENLQRGEIAPIDREFDEEKDLLESEGVDLSMGLGPALTQEAAKKPEPVLTQPGAQGKPGDKPPAKALAPTKEPKE
jgi:hypothetical protein